MKTFLLLSLLALPVSAEIRGAVRGGVFKGAADDAVGTIELDAGNGSWSFAPAFDLIRGGYGLHAVHADIRRLFRSNRNTFWIGGGPTFVNSNAPSSDRTWNVDAGVAWRINSAWQPFVAARYYRFHMPIFRDVIEGNGAVLSIGISRRIY